MLGPALNAAPLVVEDKSTNPMTNLRGVHASEKNKIGSQNIYEVTCWLRSNYLKQQKECRINCLIWL